MKNHPRLEEVSMKRSIMGTALMTLLFATIAFGQMQLSRIYSRAVREGYGLQTYVDSLLVDTRVNSGLATTRFTMVLTPGTYDYYYSVKDTVIQATEPMSFDSIEMTMGFQLPSDFVADSMWLWIDGKPVAAQIQDRALASQQYQQIVGVRRDPALLETRVVQSAHIPRHFVKVAEDRHRVPPHIQ